MKRRFFSAFTNWKNPGIRQLLKEYKIEGEMKGNAFWKNKRGFIDAVKNAKVESITPEADKAIAYRSRTKDKGQLMGMIKGYRSYPQFRNEATVDAIYNGYKSNAPMDRPLVVDFGGGKRRVFSGNTRMDAAFHSGINPEVLVVNAQKNFSSKLKEFKMVRPAKILRSPEKFNRAAAVKAIRRHLEKLPGVDKKAVRSAFGAEPLPGEITTKKQVESYIKWAKRNGEDIDPNFTKAGYVDKSTLPKFANINGRPSLLAYRGIDSGGSFEQVKRKLSRPRGGWDSPSTRNSVSQVRNRSGGIQSQPQHPNGTAMSLSTSNKLPRDFMKGDKHGEATMGVYGVDLNQLIKSVRENKPDAKVGLVNSKFPNEREVTQINGGNLLSVRKYKGMNLNETASEAPRSRLRRAFESKLGALKEFRSYAKTGQEERNDFLKAGIIGTGLAAAGGLAGLGLYKAGVSGAANKAAHLEKVMTRWRGMRQASAGAAKKAADSSLDAAVNAQKFRAARITSNIEAKKAEDRAAKAAAKTIKKQTPATPAATLVETPAKTTAVVGAPKQNAAPAAPASLNTKPPVSVTAADIVDNQEESNLTKISEELRTESKKQKAKDAALAAANKTASGAKKTTSAKKTTTTDATKKTTGATNKTAGEATPLIPEIPPQTTTQKRRAQAKRRVGQAKRRAKNAAAETAAPSTLSAYLRNIRYFDQFQTDEAGIPLTGRVAHDRFVKKIRDEDLDRRDANLLRAGLAGGAAGALFRGKLGVGKRALVGAGLGGLGVLGVRQITNNDRDIYGERNRSSKRAELIPAVGGLGAAAWLAGKRLKAFAKKFNHGGHGEHGGVKEFNDYRLYYFKGRNTGIAARSAKEAREKKKRGGDELVAVRTPNATEKSQMARGVWVRTRRDGKSPGQSKYGKGRGQGPARKFSVESFQLSGKLREFAEKREKRELNPYIGAALSGGASGAALGGLSIFKHGVSPLSALKSAGLAGAASAGIVGGGALLGSKLIGKPRSDESAPFSKRAAIGGALAGTGAGLLGAIVLKKTPMGRRWVNEWDKGKGLMGRPASWIKGSNLPGAMALGGLGGGLIGGAQGADEGQQVDSFRNLKKDMKKFSRKEFAAPAAIDLVKQAKAATTAWAKRHATEIGLTGVGIGSSVAASRYYGPKNKDWNKREEKQFSHPVLTLKKTWKTDPKLKEDFLKRVAASVRNSVAANQKQVKMFGYKDQPRNRDTMAFTGPIRGWVTGEDLVNSDGSKWQASSPQLINAMMREAKNKRVVVQRGGRLTGDVAAVLQGKDRERDASGRIKKREWEKSWFKNKATEAGLAAGGLGAAALARYGHQNKDTAVGKAYWNSMKSASNTSNDLKKIGGGILTSLNNLTGKKFSSKLTRLRELDAIADYAGWDIRDPRGRSARVFAPGSRQRERRPKEWHERAENERKLWKAKVAAAAIGGAGLALVGSRVISGKSLVPSKLVPKDPSHGAPIATYDFRKGVA